MSFENIIRMDTQGGRKSTASRAGPQLLIYAKDCFNALAEFFDDGSWAVGELFGDGVVAFSECRSVSWVQESDSQMVILASSRRNAHTEESPGWV
jgi:hypothetical protein